MEKNNPLTDLLTGAFVIIVRANPNGKGIEILTQTRDCHKKPADAIYHNAQECVGERSIWSPGKIFPALESVLDTSRRGLQEETLSDPANFKILGAGGKVATPLIATTGRDDLMMVVKPYAFFQTLEGSPFRFAPVFIAVAPASFVPKINKEVKGFNWWLPEKLLKVLNNESWRFSDTHPILLQLCRDLVENDFKIYI